LKAIDGPTMINRFSSDPSHARPFRPPARTHLDATDLDLARNLGVTVGCLRSWDRKGAPRYVQLAICALIAGIEAGGRRAFADVGPSKPKGASARAMM